MSRTVIRTLAGAVLAATLLAGCSVHPGVAAVVGDRSISQSELQQTYAQLKPMLANSDPANLLSGLITAPDVVAAAEQNGVGVSDDDAVTLLNSIVTQQKLPAVSEWTPDAVLLARSQLAAQALQKLDQATSVFAALSKTLAAHDIQVNPQYGTWSGGQITSAPPAWIASSS
ncbi:hypothetical protein Q6346_09130 [Isoptericola sp. b490]|uniref:hypothetical protein n=1 Tax=Actinotalea lenta TaxID=3064654 RepID=UPI0027123A57|nr:hypothetical protein [Isoptericola sp. b490]MDO8121473.1 hypothetical protein [Isoptericola sp. b490]